MFTDTRVLGARMRALPYNATSPSPRSSKVGQLVFMEFHTGLPLSTPHRFVGSCSILDDYSGYGRMPPVKDLTAATALESLAEFMADINISKLKGEQVNLVEVLADNVPFNSVEFKHGLATWSTGPVKLTNTSSNEHRQAGQIERMHGVRMIVHCECANELCAHSGDVVALRSKRGELAGEYVALLAQYAADAS